VLITLLLSLIYLSLCVPLTNHTAQQREKQWNRTDKANSSYSRPKKRKNENESSYNKYKQGKLTIYSAASVPVYLKAVLYE